MRLLALLLIACAPASVQAHTFGQPYTLPVPLWLYGWGASSALVVSFLAVAYFMSAAGAAAPRPAREWMRGTALLRRLRVAGVLRAAGVLLLLATVVTGAFGVRDPNRNLAMTAFWTWFVLVLSYASAVVGNLYEFANPWRTITHGLARLWPAYGRPRVRYPERAGAWPALVLYGGFIAWELLGWPRPQPLAGMLAAYTLLNLLAVALVGSEAWFRHGELFSVFFRLLSLLAPVDLRREATGPRVWLRAPGSGALDERPGQLALLIFVLAMLASTAFDGLHATRGFIALFWRDSTGLVARLVGQAPILAPDAAWPWYQAWQALCIVLAPLLYLALYAGALALAKALARSERPLRELALDFAYTLLPIVLVYHASHYFTLVLSQVPKTPSLLSDPFGWNWDLIGLRERFRATYIPDLTWTWHMQVGIILLGHVASVVLAHRVALRVFPGRRAALISQLPLLALMVGFTIFGLWILAQPLEATLVRG